MNQIPIYPKNKFPIKDDKLKYVKMFSTFYGVDGWRKYFWWPLNVMKFVGFIGQTIFAIQSFETPSRLAEICATYPIPLMAIAKFYLALVGQDKIKYFYNTVAEDFWDVDIVNSKMARKTNNRLTAIVKFLFNHWLACNMFVFLYISFPFIDPPEGKKRLPALIWSPWDTNQYPYYEFLIVVLTINLFLSVYGNGFYDFIFVYAAQHLGVQFELLNELLNNLSSDLVKYKRGNFLPPECQKIVRDRLRICTRHHDLLLRYGKTLGEFYSKILGLQLLMSVISFTIAGYILSKDHRDITKSIQILNFTASASMEVIIYGIQSSELGSKSYSVAETISQVNYDLFEPKIRKELTLMLLNAQKPINISAAGLVPIDNQVLVMIANRVFSNITLLRKLESKAAEI